MKCTAAICGQEINPEKCHRESGMTFCRPDCAMALRNELSKVDETQVASDIDLEMLPQISD